MKHFINLKDIDDKRFTNSLNDKTLSLLSIANKSLSTLRRILKKKIFDE